MYLITNKEKMTSLIFVHKWDGRSLCLSHLWYCLFNHRILNSLFIIKMGLDGLFHLPRRQKVWQKYLKTMSSSLNREHFHFLHIVKKLLENGIGMTKLCLKVPIKRLDYSFSIPKCFVLPVWGRKSSSLWPKTDISRDAEKP